ncbi:MAG: hypothetical protein JW870_05950, partial [Candidatus Delongbacteria bacterium]|nr:hypothetical protein [Candidatus Delongbacteria bacterium]
LKKATTMARWNFSKKNGIGLEIFSFSRPSLPLLLLLNTTKKLMHYRRKIVSNIEINIGIPVSFFCHPKREL